MTFTLKITCDNSAFEGENLGRKISRIVLSAAAKVERELQSKSPTVDDYDCSFALRDINGNTVGRCELKD